MTNRATPPQPSLSSFQTVSVAKNADSLSILEPTAAKRARSSSSAGS